MAAPLAGESTMKVRRLFEGFEEYGWETPSWEIAARVGLREDQIVRLDTNTSPFRPESALRDLGRVLGRMDVNQYPDTSYRSLRDGLSRYTGKDSGRFVVTNGADEGLDIIAKVFLDPGDEAIVATPTYSMYGIAASLMGAKVVGVPRGEDFSLDVDGILSSVRRRTKVIFLCNPNNPTADLSPIAAVERLAKESDVAVAVDEAYFEYCGTSAIDLTDRLENVIVCRTLSKAFSMAGVRIGYLVAGAETTRKLNVVRPPNSLSVLSLALGRFALAHVGEMRRHVRETVKERGRLVDMLAAIPGIEPYPSKTNFVLFRLRKGDPDRVHERLMEKGLVVRNLSGVRGLEGCLRTTIGTPKVNERVVEELEDALGRAPER